jgi:hypothetical protein
MYKNKLTKNIQYAETKRFNALQGDIKDTSKLINNILQDSTGINEIVPYQISRLMAK